MNKNRMKSILLSTVIAFTVSGMAVHAGEVPPGYKLGPYGLVKIPEPTPTPTTNPADPLIPLNEQRAGKELAPTSANPDITFNMGYNLAGKQMEITPLEKTQIVNNLDTEVFSENSVGAIAINDTTDRSIIAVNEFTPVGAASQVGNKDLESGNFEFVISEPVVE